MRVLFVTAAWKSHYLFMVPLAWAFHAAGHEVRVAGQPSVLPAITESGLTAVCAGPDVDFAAMHQGQVNENGGRGHYREHEAIVTMFHTVAEAMAEDLVTFARGWRPDLIIRDPVGFAACVAAAAVGVPLIRHSWGPDMFAADQGRWLEHLMQERLAPAFDHFAGSAPDDLGRWIIDPCPAGLQMPSADPALPVRFVPYNGSGSVPAWLRRPTGSTRVCVTWGTFTSSATADAGMFMVPQVIEALSELDVDVVAAVTATEAARLGDLPPQVTVAAQIPLNVLLGSCAAVVHHGGATTMLSSALYGVPQLAITHMFEQAFNGVRLAASGAGSHLPATDADVTAIRNHVSALLHDEAYLTAACGLRSEILARPTPSKVVDEIAALLRAGTLHSPPPPAAS